MRSLVRNHTGSDVSVPTHLHVDDVSTACRHQGSHDTPVAVTGGKMKSRVAVAVTKGQRAPGRQQPFNSLQFPVTCGFHQWCLARYVLSGQHHTTQSVTEDCKQAARIKVQLEGTVLPLTTFCPSSETWKYRVRDPCKWNKFVVSIIPQTPSQWPTKLAVKLYSVWDEKITMNKLIKRHDCRR